MIGWLKFYFLGFFWDKYADEGAARSFWNAVLSVALMIVLLTAGLYTGRAASFKTHYSGAEDYRAFIHNALGKVGLSVKDGKVSADIEGGDSINCFAEEDADYCLNGYLLVVDTRPAATTYDDFKLICKDGGDNEISYEAYRQLSEDDKQKSVVSVEYTGKTLDVTEKQTEYERFLDGETGESGKNALAALKEKYGKGELTEAEYADAVYVEFCGYYYPSFARAEAYGKAPTLRTYYLTKVLSGETDKFLMILDDMCLGSFVSSRGFAVEFEGNYTKLSSGAEYSEINADEFITGAVDGSGAFNFFIYLINVFKLMPIILIVVLVLALATMFIGRFREKSGLGGALKTVCSFILVSSVIAFLAAIILSFFTTRSAAYMFTAVVFNAVLFVRTAVYICVSYFKASKENKQNTETPE